MSLYTIPFRKILYQIGDGLGDYYLFSKKNLSVSLQPSVRQVVESSPGFNGDARIRGVLPDTKGSYVMNVEFLHDPKKIYDVEYIEKIFAPNNMVKVFSYTLNKDKFVERLYYNWGTVIGLPVQEYKPSFDVGKSFIQYKIQIAIPNPYWFECDDGLRYYNTTTATTNLLRDTGLQRNTGLTRDYAYSTTFPLWSTLSNTTRLSYLNAVNPTIPVTLKDRFFAREAYDLSSSNVFTYTLTSNSLVTTTSANLNLITSALNKTYLIEFQPLSTNEYIAVNNTSTNSGITITWLGAAANPNNVVYNSFWKKCFDKSLGTLIPQSNYRIEFTLNDSLYFSNLKNINPWATQTSDTLTLQKSSSGNISVTIQNLKTFN